MNKDKENIQSIKIISSPTKEDPFLIIYKPKNIPSAPLSIDDKNNALSMAIEFFPEIKDVSGKKQIEYGLLHRIDTPTDGLLLIATRQDSYDFLSKEQENNNFIKRYRAKCDFINEYSSLVDGFPFCNNSLEIKNLNKDSVLEVIQESMFRFYGPGRKEVRPVILDDSKASIKKSTGKIYTTKIKVLKKDSIYVDCEITNGFRHQVRCHLAWMNLPIKGDLIYNKNACSADDFLFTAYELEFLHPVTKKVLKYSI